MNTIIVVVFLTPLIILWMTGAPYPPADALAHSQATCGKRPLPPQPPSGSKVEPDSPDAVHWSVLDDYRLTRLLSDSGPRRNSD